MVQGENGGTFFSKSKFVRDLPSQVTDGPAYTILGELYNY